MARLPVIEVMRGAAAASVALFHFSGAMHSPLPTLFHGYGWLGVDVFFVVSGFVIPLSLIKVNYDLSDFPAFVLRRLARLEPTYFLSIAIIIALGYLSELAPQFAGVAPIYTVDQIAAHAFYVIPLTGFSWVNPAYWSLSYEFAFYILVGLTFPLFNRSSIIIPVAGAALIFAMKYSITSKCDPFILEFLVGYICARIYTRGGDGQLYGCTACAVAVIFWTGYGTSAIVVAASAATILLMAPVNFGTWAIVAGELSYSLYLIHIPIGGRVVNLAARYGSGSAYECAVLGAALIGSLLCAFAMVHFVERPAIKLARRLSPISADHTPSAGTALIGGA